MKNLKIIRKKETQTLNWSGGTTRELFIYPEKSSYAARNFLFRLSVATIEVPTSDFTPLEGIRRTTLILDGEITISHQGKYSKTLKPLEQDSYDGAWKTSSVGICSDFNLMLRESAKGTVYAFKEAAEIESFDFEKAAEYFLFVRSGNLQIAKETLTEGDLLHFKLPFDWVDFKASKASLVLCEVKLED